VQSGACFLLESTQYVRVVTSKSKSPRTAQDVAARPNNTARTLAEAKRTEDVALVLGKSPSGEVNILRKRADRLEAGTLVPLEEGKPLRGEVVQLHQRAGSRLYDVEVHVSREELGQVLPEAASASALNGPAQVATDTYRKNWDAIYKRSPDRKLLN
jgi:hypothetical protein